MPKLKKTPPLGRFLFGELGACSEGASPFIKIAQKLKREGASTEAQWKAAFAAARRARSTSLSAPRIQWVWKEFLNIIAETNEMQAYLKRKGVPPCYACRDINGNGKRHAGYDIESLVPNSWPAFKKWLNIALRERGYAPLTN
jgi:hypothetical protein